MVGLGRMGSNLVRRLMRDGHPCVGFDVDPAAVSTLAGEGATGVGSLEKLVAALPTPRNVWLMLPAGEITERAMAELAGLLEPGDAIIDGGNGHYVDDLHRGGVLAETGIHYADVGVSGGVFGLERGFCLMVGSDDELFARMEPLFVSLAPGVDTAARTRGREGTPAPAEMGYLHCGPVGAGHFVKMVHNGIEYGAMAALAEGLNVLHGADAGDRAAGSDVETAPLEHPARYRFSIDVAEVAEVWRRGSVVSSWLLDLAAAALHDSPTLDGFAGRVSDSGEGRWTAVAAIEEGVPTPVLSAALFARFSSRGEADFANRVLSAMRKEFGGHAERQG
jgi:6-phosphogluconate dehydrogenase